MHIALVHAYNRGYKHLVEWDVIIVSNQARTHMQQCKRATTEQHRDPTCIGECTALHNTWTHADGIATHSDLHTTHRIIITPHWTWQGGWHVCRVRGHVWSLPIPYIGPGRGAGIYIYIYIYRYRYMEMRFIYYIYNIYKSRIYIYIYILDTSFRVGSAPRPPFKSAWRPPRCTDIFQQIQQV